MSLKNILVFLVTLGIAFSAVYQIEITNPNNYDLTDFQVLINVSNITSTFTDLNITLANNSSVQIPYCLVQIDDFLKNVCGQTYNGIDLIWVKVPNIPANGTAVLSVDPGGTADLPQNVFILYDDIENTGAWTVLGGIQFNTANPYEGTTAIRKTNNNQQIGAIRSIPTTITNEDTVLEFWTYANSGNQPIERVGVFSSSSLRGVGYYLDVRGVEFIGIDDYTLGFLTVLVTTPTTGVYNVYVPNRFYMWNKQNDTYISVSYDNNGAVLGQISYTSNVYDNFDTLYFYGRRDYYGDVFTIRKIAPNNPTYRVVKSPGFFWVFPTNGTVFTSSPQNFTVEVFDPTIQNCYSVLDNNTIINTVGVTGPGIYNISTNLVLGKQSYTIWCDDGNNTTFYYPEIREITYDNTPPTIDRIEVNYDPNANELTVDVYVTETQTAVDTVLVYNEQLNQTQTAINTGIFYRAIFSIALNDGDKVNGTAIVNDTVGWTSNDTWEYIYTTSSSVQEWADYSFDGFLVVDIKTPKTNTVIPSKAYVIEFEVTNLYDSNPHPLLCKFYISYDFDFYNKIKVLTKRYNMTQTNMTFKERVPTEVTFLDLAGNYVRDMPPQQQIVIICGLEDVKQAGYDQEEYQTAIISRLSQVLLLLTILSAVLGFVVLLYSDYGVIAALVTQILLISTTLSLSVDGISNALIILDLLIVVAIFSNLLFMFSLLKLAFESRENYKRGI